ncbi:MAG TPA: hypothetical protein V6C58_29055 [Allocoleopsis sp.]
MKSSVKLYNELQKQRFQFINFVSGIDNENDKKWYVSVIIKSL